MDRIFVYGTLRPSLYPHRRPIDRVVEPARLRDNLAMFDLGYFPALVESDDEHEIVGETFEVPSIRMYDAYESYLPNGKGLYDRRVVTIKTESGKELGAWIYFMHADKFKEDGAADYGKPVPSGDWADSNGFKSGRRNYSYAD